MGRMLLSEAKNAGVSVIHTRHASRAAAAGRAECPDKVWIPEIHLDRELEYSLTSLCQNYRRARLLQRTDDRP